MIAIPIPRRTPVALLDTAPTIEHMSPASAAILPRAANRPAPRIATATMTDRNAMPLRISPVMALVDRGFLFVGAVA